MLLLNNAQILSLQLQQLGGLLDLLTAIGFHQPPPPASSAAALQFSSIVKMELVEARLSSSEYASAAISPCQGGWNTSGDAAGRPLPPNSPPSPFLLYSHRLVSQENVNCITFSLLYTLLPDLIAHMPEMKAFVLPVHVKFKLQTVHSNFLDARAQIVLSIVRYWRNRHNIIIQQHQSCLESQLTTVQLAQSIFLLIRQRISTIESQAIATIHEIISKNLMATATTSAISYPTTSSSPSLRSLSLWSSPSSSPPPRGDLGSIQTPPLQQEAPLFALLPPLLQSASLFYSSSSNSPSFCDASSSGSTVTPATFFFASASTDNDTNKVADYDEFQHSWSSDVRFSNDSDQEQKQQQQQFSPPLLPLAPLLSDHQMQQPAVEQEEVNDDDDDIFGSSF